MFCKLMRDAGLIASYSEPGVEVQADRLLSSILFAAPGYSTIVSLSKVERITLANTRVANWRATLKALPRFGRLIMFLDQQTLTR
jgi:hypothetical protein